MPDSRELSISHDNLVIDNVVRGNGGDGIDLTAPDRKHLERNTYGRNAADVNGFAGETYTTSPDTTCGTPELCEEGAGNESFGDNLIPGHPPRRGVLGLPDAVCGALRHRQTRDLPAPVRDTSVRSQGLGPRGSAGVSR